MAERDEGQSRAGCSDMPPARVGGTGITNRLMEPTLLAALATKPRHGYDLRRAIEEMTGGYLRIDSAGIYRLLRRLEAEGVVASTWTEGVFGPQRRDYSLTAEGLALLQVWREQLVRQHRACELTVESIDTALCAVDSSKNVSALTQRADSQTGDDGTEVDA